MHRPERGPLTDDELLRRVASGDEQALRTFVDRHQATVFRFASSLHDDLGAVEDALQETFLTVWRKAATFRSEGSARSWLFTIARRALLGSLRRRPAGEPHDDESLQQAALAAGWGSSVEPIDSRIDLQHALGRLKATDREVLLLRDVEGLSTSEAAGVLGIEERALKSRLHRARLRLMAQLRGEWRDER